jgi:hypothetical protein
MRKDYLIQILQRDSKFLNSLKEGDTIIFDMPPFCSGDYDAKILKDSNGLYIMHKDNFFKGCRNYFKKRK